jgi:hypothetical protein
MAVVVIGHRYTVKSGVAIIIGEHTKKKFMGVRNKFCSICVMELRKATTNPARLL